MRTVKASAALALAAALAVSGCSKSADKPANSPSPSAGAASSSAPAKEHLTLNWLTFGDANSTLPSPDKDFVLKTIEQKFNVTLKLQYAPNSQEYTNKLSLMVNSGTTPDMFEVGGLESAKFIMDKVGADLTNLVTPQTMPNYFKWVTPDELKRYQPAGTFMRAPIPFSKTNYISYYARKDWLDKLGLKVPTNYDEMIEVMKAFTFKDPDGNGKNDTYGLSAAGNGVNGAPRDFPEWYKNKIGPGFLLQGDQFIDTGTSLQAGQVLADMKKTLDLKIVDPDWFLNKPGDQLTKVEQGKVGIFYSGARDAAFDNTPTSVLKKTRDITGVKDADFVPFMIAGDSGVSYQALPGNPFMLSAKSPEANQKRTIEILDWLASPEGFLLTHYGQEGAHYKKDGNKIELNVDAIQKDIVSNGNFLDIWGAIFGPGITDLSPIGLELVDPRETDHDRAILKTLKTYVYTPLGTNLTPVPGTDLGALRKQMNVYYSKILFDEKDASNWPKYRQDLMTTYKGKEIFGGYAAQVSTAWGKTYNFKADN